MKSKLKAGDPVGVVARYDPTSDTVKIFGLGVYMGNKKPKTGVFKNQDLPCIKLENGTYLWGYQCAGWYPLTTYTKMIESRRKKHVVQNHNKIVPIQ